MNLHSLDAYAWNHNRRAHADLTHRALETRSQTPSVWTRLGQRLNALLALLTFSRGV